MWLLTHTSNGCRFYFAADKRNYTVGRLGADLELQADICVSRSHAVFHVEEDHIELEDAGSKYGTFHNLGIEKNTTLEKGRKVKLKINDLIRFGRLQNVWKVEKLTFNTVTSSLSKEDVAEVAVSLASVGGKVLEQWSPDCTHLTMKEPSVTVKLLHALVDQKYIVTPVYWKDLATAVSSKNESLPKAELYCPDLGDANFDVGCKVERRNLFKGTTFVFLSRKHFDMYGPIVKAAGGSCKDINSGVQKAFLIKNNVVVIQYNPSTQTQSSQTISTIAEFLQSHSKRIIPEYEIGMAILNCSVDEFCNPTHKMSETMAQTVSNENPDNTMTVDLTDGDTTPIINTKSLDFEIPETNENLVTSTPYENPLSCADSHDKEDDQETMPNMHITETPVHVENRKRKHPKIMSIDSDGSDNDDLFQFAKKTCTEKINKNLKVHAKNVDKEICPKSSSNTTSKQDKVEAEKSTESEARTTRKSSSRDFGETSKKDKVEEEKSTNPKARTVKKSAFADFLEKTQNKNKPKSLSPPKDSEDNSCSTSKGARKRPRIQVLGENDNEGEEDDLFCFADTQPCKKKPNINPHPVQEEEDDLFGFKEKEPRNSKHSNHLELNEDSNDMQATEQFVITPKPAKVTTITIPKPKILPRKISAVEWISGSLGKINIKNEISSVLKSEEDIKAESDIKPNVDDLHMTDDHRKWLESLKDAIVIQAVSLNSSVDLNEKSHYIFRNQQNTSDDLNGSKRNFKTFVKRYQPPQKDSTVVQLHLR